MKLQVLKAVGKVALRFGSWCFAHREEAIAIVQTYQAVKSAKK